jgi:hypothetical protein
MQSPSLGMNHSLAEGGKLIMRPHTFTPLFNLVFAVSLSLPDNQIGGNLSLTSTGLPFIGKGLCSWWRCLGMSMSIECTVLLILSLCMQRCLILETIAWLERFPLSLERSHRWVSFMPIDANILFSSEMLTSPVLPQAHLFLNDNNFAGATIPIELASSQSLSKSSATLHSTRKQRHRL